MLEGYSYEEPWPETIGEFSLKYTGEARLTGRCSEIRELADPAARQASICGARLTVMRRMFYLAQQRCQLIEIDRLANMMIEACGRR
ncbi:MAG: hypothetical protein JWN43_1619 [Gammaproteobacteria bacterium]|nr:hypothetical protein [Gammaproteobacteria bacterium]